MKSATVPTFWDTYRELDPTIRVRVRKAFRLWLEDPFHPSLRFKCINNSEGIWAVRVTLGFRAVGLLEDDTVTWFWVGSHDAYERFFG
jgi:hypothetical protein